MNQFLWDKKKADEATPAATVSRLMERYFGKNEVRKATPTEDRAGVDFWVTAFGATGSVDVKTRTKSYLIGDDKNLENYWHNRDLVIEINSTVYSDGRPPTKGWAIDLDKGTDYFLFYYPDTDWCFLANANDLKSFVNKHRHEYKVESRRNGNNGSGYIKVPLIDFLRKGW